MIKIIVGQLPREIPESSGLKINVDDKRIDKALDGGVPLLRQMSSATIKDVMHSLLAIHKYASVDMVVHTENESLIAEFGPSEKKEFFYQWCNEKQNIKPMYA